MQLRNIAIIAHVDHGKTTLVEQLLRQSGTLGNRESGDALLDTNSLERERGITILSKITGITWDNLHINLVDTPGHADFGGEVERILSMVDAVLLVVDASEGPMPQTRFVTQKAFAHQLRPIVIVNKVDRPTARPDWVVDQVFELFVALGASEEALDFPVLYTSAILGQAGTTINEMQNTLYPLVEAILKNSPSPEADVDAPLQMQICQFDYDNYLGPIGIGKISRGRLQQRQSITLLSGTKAPKTAKIEKIFHYCGLQRVEVSTAEAGDIVAITGLGPLEISDTLCDPTCLEAAPLLQVDEPTVTVNFCVNTSPFCGREGKFVTSRQLLTRLQLERLHNVALRVEETADPDTFKVSGRGELHLAILIETLRREGYELAVTPPKVILKGEKPDLQEPFEEAIFDLPTQHQGSVMQALGLRRGDLISMQCDNTERIRLEYSLPSRGLIGFRSAFLTLTSGSGIMHTRFTHYGPYKPGTLGQRANGVLISNGTGKVPAYALFGLQDRGRLLIEPGCEVYEGQIIGLHSRSNDLTVNCLQNKKLTNMRAAGKDDAVILTPALRWSLEQSLEFIEEDELLEVTPAALRLRKKHLTEALRRGAKR